MNQFEIVEVFEHKGRLCIIVRSNVRGVAHNGYVEAHPKRKKSKKVFSHKLDITYDKYHITADEPTYSGWGVCGKHEDKYFIGFDSLHHWNTLEPESQTHASVKARLLEFADEVIAIETTSTKLGNVQSNESADTANNNNKNNDTKGA